MSGTTKKKSWLLRNPSGDVRSVNSPANILPSASGICSNSSSNSGASLKTG